MNRYPQSIVCSGVALLLAAFLAATPALAAPEEIAVQATLAPDPIGLDELAQLTLSIESRGLRLPEIEPSFSLDNLAIAGGPSRSQSTSWINGQTSSRLELTWRLRPSALGAATVSSIRLHIGGVMHTAADVSIEVVADPPARSRSRRRNPPADPFRGLFDDDPFAPFRRRDERPAVQPKVRLRASARPDRLFVGQQSVWQLDLETQTDISAFRPQSLPEFAGFWARELDLPERPQPEWIEKGGERIARFTMLARALFPLRAGSFRIEPAQVQVAARLVDPSFFGGFGRDEPLDLESGAVALEVLPLPASPPGFSGLVGTITAAATISPRKIESGKATTLTLELGGDANLQGVAPPTLNLPAGLRAFPPTVEIEAERIGGRLASKLVASYVVVADRGGRWTLDPVRITVFDPRAERYREIEAATGMIEAFAASAPPKTAPAAGRPGAAAPLDESGRDAGSGLDPRWLGGAAALALGLAAGLWIRRRSRQPGPRRRLREGLERARAAPTPRAGAAILEETWRTYLAEKYDLPRSLPVGHWPQRLGAEGVPAALARALVTLFEETHLLEFAPELADAEALRDDLVRRSRELSRQLR